MGRVAVGRPCPHCGTLVTCSGDDSAEFLIGTCVVDRIPMTVAHAHPATGAVNLIHHGVPSTSESDAKMPELAPTIIDESYVATDADRAANPLRLVSSRESID